mgnify:CR=1 FL=1
MSKGEIISHKGDGLYSVKIRYYREQAERKMQKLQDKIDKEKSNRYQKRPDPVVWEEDLHINELVESVVGMTNHEILTFQMNHFHKILNKAIKENVDNLIFIHGIGNGTLKTTLRKSLEEDYNLYFEDASFKEYGFGATKVFPKTKQ